MAYFIDNIIKRKYDTQYPKDSLIHTYNKNYFESIDEATEMLNNKVLLPGEVAFSYYYDPNIEHGSNAIFAVGPLTNGAGNIIFKNSNDIDKKIESLNDLLI